jgi:cell division protein FtsI/penicillin-binding protein 2
LIRKSSGIVKKNDKTVDKKLRSRVLFIIILSIIAYSVIISKLYIVQVMNHDYYAKKYKEQSRRKITLFSPKGIIYDRKYHKLAENIGFNLAFGINTKYVKNKKDLAKRISNITGADSERYMKALNSKTGFVWVANDLTEKERSQVLGILTEEESSAASFDVTPNRIYPQGKTAGQILGYIDIDGKGLSGIEKEYSDNLSGKDGWEYIFKDGKQKKSFGPELNKKDPVPGNSVVLTIDDNYQTIVEDELAKAVTEWKGQKGVAIVMEPNSGEILAMASYPDFDPNKPGDYDPFARKNKAITDFYEPGSTFKTLSTAILFEENLVNETDMFFCSNNGYRIGSRVIKDSHKNPVENMNFMDVIANSSNIGTLQAMMRLDKQKHYEYLRDFGFGNKTEIGLIGEVKGYLLKPGKWSQTTQPTISFGQGISVTPLQLVTAYAAIANGGNLVKPMIVKGIIDKDNNIVKKFEPFKVRRVISQKTSERVRKVLRYVVENGTGKGAEIPGLKIGGKTGTSQKVVAGSYSKNCYDASFIGMVPYDDPKLICYVMVDTPKGCIYGGTVCAPAFRNIIKRIYDENRSRSFSDNKNESLMIEVPDITGMKISDAEDILKSKGIVYKVESECDVIAYQSQKPFSLIKKSECLIISGKTDTATRKEKLKLTPSVTSLSLREAVKLLHSLNIETVVEGKGSVYRQSALIKDELTGAERCSLFCRLPIPDKTKKLAMKK